MPERGLVRRVAPSADGRLSAPRRPRRGAVRLDGRGLAMTGRDLVAVILAAGLVVAFLVYVVGVVFRGYVPSPDVLTGALLGALVAVLARYVLDRRNGPGDATPRSTSSRLPAG